MNALVQLFFGMAPERPAWLRRLVQGFWILLVIVVLVAFGFGLATLARRL